MRCDVLAISSPGGHWVELTRLFPAFEGRTVEYATTDAGRVDDVPGGRLHVLTDANKRTPWRLLICAWQVFRLVLKYRPRVIVTTGAAPGFLAILFGQARRRTLRLAGHFRTGGPHDAVWPHGETIRRPVPGAVGAPRPTGWSALPGFAAVIFVTVGTQLPFERLVGTVDCWAAGQSPRPDVLAQVGCGRMDYAHIRCERTLDGNATPQRSPQLG